MCMLILIQLILIVEIEIYEDMYCQIIFQFAVNKLKTGKALIKRNMKSKTPLCYSINAGNLS